MSNIPDPHPIEMTRAGGGWYLSMYPSDVAWLCHELYAIRTEPALSAALA